METEPIYTPQKVKEEYSYYELWQIENNLPVVEGEENQEEFEHEND